MTLRILDYGKPNPFGGTLGKPRNLAWPVAAYRVTLPRILENGGGLNPFERVILKLLDADGAMDAEKLEEETCIPISLVQCVLLRLRDKGFIDEYNAINSNNRGGWQKEEADPVNFATALLFRERATAKILPFVHVLDNNPVKIREGEEKSFRRIRWAGGSDNALPTPREVITALFAMNKRLRAVGGRKRLPAVQQITIVDEPEYAYLDCPIAIQKNDGEFRIADPFGNGFSLLLENTFNHILEQDENLRTWLTDWKLDLSDSSRYEQVTSHTEPYDTEKNRERYPKLIDNLRLRSNTRYRSIEQIHHVLEWALFYSCLHGPYETALNHLLFTTQTEHPDLLAKAAQTIGLNPPPNGFRAVWPGKLEDFRAEKPDLGTVTAVTLLMAQNDASHSLRSIAARNRNFPTRLFEIKKRRDELAHGQGKVRTDDIELPEETFMRDTVTALLPSIRFSDADQVKVDKDAATDLRFDARTRIQDEFGIGTFNRLGTELQNRLIVAESFLLMWKDGEDAHVFAYDAYAAVQAAFQKMLSGHLTPDISDAEFCAKARRNAEEAGLGPLPEALSTVKASAIRRTLQGDGQTLGACAVAFLLLSESDTLQNVQSNQPSFLSDIEYIVNMRGHGNQPLPLSEDDIRKFRRTTVLTIKTLLEV